MFHNMALCYQNLSMLPETAASIAEALAIFPLDAINIEEQSAANRMVKLGILAKL
jgi:hypothetical protein